ncbi:hypothetical protein HYW40_01030 [Candidatus Curtissbacteria bacterium]|nr:hypothetical protein [Candidatus Curtissbacteria bacterium]
MTLDRAILATLAYHDIFDYPLKEAEVRRYLIGRKASGQRIEKEIANLLKNKKIIFKKGYFCLKNRGEIIKLREARTGHSKTKLKRANFFSILLTPVTTIKLVAVSGALAMGNAKKNDDIDLVIVTARNTLWTTRLLANIILLPLKRKPGLITHHSPLITNNKACLNLFIDESNLKISDKNLYTAHEICQMKPLWQRGNTYSRFLKANSWVKNYLPNWEPDAVNGKWKIVNRPSFYSPFTIHHSLVEHIEALAKWGQLNYMKKKITAEKIMDHQLFFHPKDTQSWVLKSYARKLAKIT